MHRPYRLIAALTATLLGAAMTTTSSAAASPSQSTSSITLQFPSWQENEPGYTQFWTSMDTEFERAHPGVTIHFYELGFNNFIPSILERFAAGDPPDILQLPAGDEPTFGSKGYLANLNSYFAADNNLASHWIKAEAFEKQNGNYYGIIMQAFGGVLYYNPVQLAKYHISSPPKTLSQLLTDAKEATGSGNYGIAMVTASDLHLFTWMSDILTGLGQKWITHDKWNITSQGDIHALNVYRSLAADAPPAASDSAAEAIYQAGRAAFLLDQTYEYQTLRTTPKEGAGVSRSGMELLPLPHQVSLEGPSLQIPATLSPARKQLVWDFMKQVASLPSQELFIKDVQEPVGLVAANRIMAKTLPDGRIQNAAVDGLSAIPLNKWFESNYATIDQDMAKGLSAMLASSGSMNSLATTLQDGLPSVGSTIG